MMSFSKRMFEVLSARKVQLALAVRIAVAAVAAYTIAVALHLMLPLWAVLTSLIVTQMSVGRSLKATRDYMLGTIGGAIYGGAIAVLIPHSGEGSLLALLVLAVTPLAFIAAINPSLSSATVTAVIVLLLPTMHQSNPLDSAIDRVVEVTVGALTGLAVSFLVLPSRAISQIRAQCGEADRIACDGVRRVAGGPDAWSRQRRPAPDPGWHRGCGDKSACDRGRGRTRTCRAVVFRAGHRTVAADDIAIAP